MAAAVWLFIKLPFALILGGLGLVCCVTILLIPLGGKCFRFAVDVLNIVCFQMSDDVIPEIGVLIDYSSPKCDGEIPLFTSVP